jgi:hypothetical protein
MGFWLLVPGVLMGGGDIATVPTGAVWAHSEATVLIIPGSRQPTLTIPGQ